VVTTVSSQTALFPMGGWDGQVDHIHLYRTERFEPSPRMSTAQLIAENIHDIRWWSPEELTSSNATFAPRSLPQLLHRLRQEGVPANPIELTGF
jgi:8-oxo-dGTP diphosphatase